MALTKVRGSGIDADGQEIILDADTDTTITADTDDQIDVKVAGTDQITIKDGAVSPVTNNDIDLGTSSLSYKDIYLDGQLKFNNFEIGDQSIDGNTIIFRLADETETMRIDSSGNFMIGATSSTALLNVRGQTAPLAVMFNSSNSDKVILQMRHDFARGSQNATMIQFLNNDGDEKGSVKTTSTATTFNTSSDYRLKENVSYDWDATSRLKQLKPCRFNWISDETNTLVDGFLAHEVSNSVPEAITGDKDATETYTDDDGKEKTRIKPQGIDQSKLVPLLVKTIQELEARIAKLESK